MESAADPHTGLREARELLQATLLAVQALMRQAPSNRSLQQAIAMLFCALDSLDEVER